MLPAKLPLTRNTSPGQLTILDELTNDKNYLTEIRRKSLARNRFSSNSLRENSQTPQILPLLVVRFVEFVNIPDLELAKCVVHISQVPNPGGIHNANNLVNVE